MDKGTSIKYEEFVKLPDGCISLGILSDSIDGINNNYLRPFLTIDRISQSKRECIECDVASGCAWCQGGNYDFAETSTIFQRATYICKLHKARVRANNYFWNRLDYKIKLNGKN